MTIGSVPATGKAGKTGAPLSWYSSFPTSTFGLSCGPELLALEPDWTEGLLLHPTTVPRNTTSSRAERARMASLRRTCMGCSTGAARVRDGLGPAGRRDGFGP